LASLFGFTAGSQLLRCVDPIDAPFGQGSTGLSLDDFDSRS
jgi:hypothetical protein